MDEVTSLLVRSKESMMGRSRRLCSVRSVSVLMEKDFRKNLSASARLEREMPCPSSLAKRETALALPAVLYASLRSE